MSFDYLVCRSCVGFCAQVVLVQQTPRIRRPPARGPGQGSLRPAGFTPVTLQSETKGRLVSRPPTKEIASKRQHKQDLCSLFARSGDPVRMHGAYLKEG